MLGISLADVFRAQAADSTSTKPLLKSDTSVIFVWLPGGPPHMEMYDMKPDAPTEYRGVFKPIPTNVSGIEISELMPLQAKIADKFNIIRSVHHDFADHGGGHKRLMTGRVPATPTGTVNDAPSVPSIVNRLLRGESKNGMPVSVLGADSGRAGIDVFAVGSAYLGSGASPFIVGGDPSSPEFKVNNLGVSRDMAARLDDRMTLLKGMDSIRRDLDRGGLMGAMDEFSQRAMAMLTSEQVREAFDLSKEPASVRERYGMHAFGQRGLMARRLVESGCRFVTMVWEQPYPSKGIPKDCSYNWDSHAVNCHIFNDARWRIPPYDQAVSALIEDLHQRGLDKRTLLIVTGEFGRTPKVNTAVGTQTKITQPGRDHWPQSMSLIMAGGGMRTGQIIGATNRLGEYPVERPLTPNDLWATVYTHLGIDYTESFLDHQGRPMPILPFGEPVEELLPSRA